MSEERWLKRGFRVLGRVQGVFFRAWTQETAQGLGVSGTVRNRGDGSVEAHVVGDPRAVEAFERRLWKGPPAARVDAVEVFESEAVLPEGRFEIRY